MTFVMPYTMHFAMPFATPCDDACRSAAPSARGASVPPAVTVSSYLHFGCKVAGVMLIRARYFNIFLNRFSILF